MANAKKGRYVLSGWYEVESGAEPVFVRGRDLTECVQKLVQYDSDFGHTEAELMGGYLVPDYDVTSDALLQAIQIGVVEARKSGWM